MKIAEVRHIEDCFDGSYLYEILFDTEITPAFIQSLGTEGRLQYHRDFARPFFKATFDGCFTIKGVEGNKTARILAYDKNLEPTLDHIRRLIPTCAYIRPAAGCTGTEQDTDGTENYI